MKIALFLTNDLLIVPELIATLIQTKRADIAKVFVSKISIQRRIGLKKSLFFLKNFYPFCIRLTDWIQYGAWLNQKKTSKNLAAWLRSLNINVEEVENINDELFLESLKVLAPDICLFCPFDQIAKAPFLSIPRLGSFNVHLGKLPEYRGGLSTFWALRFGDKTTGVTVHRAVSKLDAGDIVAEKHIPVTHQSMRVMMMSVAQTGAALVCRAIDLIETEQWIPIDIAGRKPGYYYLPTSYDFSVFYRRGCSLC